MTAQAEVLPLCRSAVRPLRGRGLHALSRRVRRSEGHENRSARGEGSSTGPQGGDDAAPIGCRSALRGKQMQTEKEGSLSFAEAIIKVDIEYHMMHECMFCELEATKVTDR